MRRGFTFIELIFVVTIVGILIAVAIPRMMEKDDLSLAADQVITHIRYTQHLALMEDKFDRDDIQWFEERWQIYFHSNLGSNNKLAYSIFTDYGHNTNPNVMQDEIAVNPLDRTKLMTGGFDAVLAIGDSRVDETLCLGCAYGIGSINFSPACTDNQGANQSQRLSFDEIGRPYYRNPQGNPYRSDRRLLNTCTLTLTHQNGETARICIEPETGYAHRCD